MTVSGTGHTYNTANQIGFKFLVSDGTCTLHATNADGVDETATDTGLTITSFDDFLLSAVYTPEVDIKFYVGHNGAPPTLVATHTTNLPSTTATPQLSQFSVSNDSTANDFTFFIPHNSISLKIV